MTTMQKHAPVAAELAAQEMHDEIAARAASALHLEAVTKVTSAMTREQIIATIRGAGRSSTGNQDRT